MQLLAVPGWTALLGATLASATIMAQTATVPQGQPALQKPAAQVGQSVQPQTSQQSIGHIDPSATVEKIQVSGAVTLSGGSTLLGNGSTVTAGQHTLPIHLTRGGELDLCTATSVHLSQKNSAADPNSPLMLALNRGALEAHYKLGKNSDVVLTPDLSILLSGPGKANVSIRVNAQGDTCVNNKGNDAPYLTVSEQLGSGVYRVQPNQRVLFEHGSVRDVVDHEGQPCGCPVNPPVSVAAAGVPSKRAANPDEAIAKPGQAVANAKSKAGGPSSTPADTAFPLAESEGLVPPPKLSAPPKVAPGMVQSQVTSTLSYIAPKQAVPTGLPSGMATPASAATTAAPEAAVPVPSAAPASSPTIAQAPPPKPARKHTTRRVPGILHKIGRFFVRMFG